MAMRSLYLATIPNPEGRQGGTRRGEGTGQEEEEEKNAPPGQEAQTGDPPRADKRKKETGSQGGAAPGDPKGGQEAEAPSRGEGPRTK